MDKILKILGVILLIITIIVIIILGSKTHKSYETISSEEAYKMMKKDVIVLDVRTKEEYNKTHIKDAINIPLDEIDENIDLDKNKKILVYCQSGNRSQKASSLLSSYGYEVYNFGGIQNWPYDVE